MSDYDRLISAGHDPDVAKRWVDDLKQDRERQAREQSHLHDAAIRESIGRWQTGGRDASSGVPLLLIVCLLMVYFGYRILSGNESW